MGIRNCEWDLSCPGIYCTILAVLWLSKNTAQCSAPSSGHSSALWTNFWRAPSSARSAPEPGATGVYWVLPLSVSAYYFIHFSPRPSPSPRPSTASRDDASLNVRLIRAMIHWSFNWSLDNRKINKGIPCSFPMELSSDILVLGPSP